MSDTETRSGALGAVVLLALAAGGLYLWSNRTSGPDCSGRTGGHSVELHAQWVALDARAPKVFWSHKGQEKPVENTISHDSGPGKHFDGEWSALVTAQCGDTLGVRMVAVPEALADGQYYQPQISGACSIVDGEQQVVKLGRNCSATYTTP